MRTATQTNISQKNAKRGEGRSRESGKPVENGSRKAQRLPIALILAAVCLQVVSLDRWPDDGIELLILMERLLCVWATVFIATNLLGRMPKLFGRCRAIPRHVLMLGGLLLFALVVRLLVPVFFLHVEFVGLRYVGLAMDFGSVSFNAPSYGQAGFLTQGGLAYLLGGGLRAFFFVNTLASVAAVGFAAALVARWTGSKFAAPAAVLVLGAVHPILVRVGASEDVHIFAALYGLMSLWAIERFSMSGRRGDLYLAVAAGFLTACSRQIFLFMPLLMLILLVEHKGWRGLRVRPLPLALTGLALASAVRLSVLVAVFRAGGPGIQGGFSGGGGIGRIMGRYLEIAVPLIVEEPNPLFVQGLTPAPVLMLFLVGCYAIVVRKRAPRAVLLAWLYLFAASVVFVTSRMQTGYLFRTVDTHLVLIIAGLGWGGIWLWLRGRQVNRLITFVFIVVSVVVPVVMVVPTIIADAVDDPATREAFFIEAAADRLPRNIVIVKASSQDLDVHNMMLDFPSFLLDRRGVSIRTISIAEWQAGLEPTNLPIALFRGVACHSMSVFELDPRWRNPDRRGLDTDAKEFLQFFRTGHPGTARIERAREACFFEDEPLAPLRDDLVITVDPRGFVPGHLYYVERPFEIGFYRLDERSASILSNADDPG